MVIKISISPGELIDKITILEIKSASVKDKLKLKIIASEQKLLNKEFEKIKKNFPASLGKIKALKKKLYSINKKLWDTEDKLRLMESKKKFGKEFIEASRQVYLNNDKRSKLKNELNNLLGSKLAEIKSYAKY